jgi:hypothetical protein
LRSAAKRVSHSPTGSLARIIKGMSVPRSPPAEKACVPAPVTTTTRTLSSVATSRQKSASRTTISGDSALRFSGRFSVMMATPSRCSTSK